MCDILKIKFKCVQLSSGFPLQLLRRFCLLIPSVFWLYAEKLNGLLSLIVNIEHVYDYNVVVKFNTSTAINIDHSIAICIALADTSFLSSILLFFELLRDRPCTPLVAIPFIRHV